MDDHSPALDVKRIQAAAELWSNDNGQMVRDEFAMPTSAANPDREGLSLTACGTSLLSGPGNIPRGAPKRRGIRIATLSKLSAQCYRYRTIVVPVVDGAAPEYSGNG